MTYLFQNAALGQLTERASQYSLGDLSTSEVAIVSCYNIKYSCKSTLMCISVHCQDDKEEEILVVSFANTVVYPWTVVIKIL